MPFSGLVDLTADEDWSRSLAERAGLVVTFTTCWKIFVLTRNLSDIGVPHACITSDEAGQCLHATTMSPGQEMDVLMFMRSWKIEPRSVARIVA